MIYHIFLLWSSHQFPFFFRSYLPRMSNYIYSERSEPRLLFLEDPLGASAMRKQILACRQRWSASWAYRSWPQAAIALSKRLTSRLLESSSRSCRFIVGGSAITQLSGTSPRHRATTIRTQQFHVRPRPTSGTLWYVVAVYRETSRPVRLHRNLVPV